MIPDWMKPYLVAAAIILAAPWIIFGYMGYVILVLHYGFGIAA